jgi:2-haloacid dehalogenase
VAVRALAFDVFGTLVDWRTGVADAFRKSGLPGDAEELADAWRARFWPILAEVNSGARPWGDFDDLHFATLDDLLAERGVEVPGEERRRLVGAWHQLDPWRDVRSGLEALRRQRVTAALSNGHVALLVDLARYGDLRFDCLVSAELVHLYKPAPEVYQAAARLLGVEPGELMMVASHPGDLWGARRAGLKTAFLDRPREYGSDSPAREDPDADESADGLHELAERLAD